MVWGERESYSRRSRSQGGKAALLQAPWKGVLWVWAWYVLDILCCPIRAVIIHSLVCRSSMGLFWDLGCETEVSWWGDCRGLPGGEPYNSDWESLGREEGLRGNIDRNPLSSPVALAGTAGNISPWLIPPSRPLVLRVDSAFVEPVLISISVCVWWLIYATCGILCLYYSRLFPLHGSSCVGLFILSRVFFFIYR